MICAKCSALNGNEDRFCQKCGAPLLSEGQRNGSAYASDDLAAQNATTMIAARDARLVDVKNMRPLTRAAYNVCESEHGPALSLLVSLCFVVLSLGMVAVLIKIFETITKLGQSMVSSEIEGSLSDLFYSTATANNAQLLGWLIALFVLMVAAFLVCGKLNLRIKKVNRKKKKEQLDSRL